MSNQVKYAADQHATAKRDGKYLVAFGIDGRYAKPKAAGSLISTGPMDEDLALKLLKAWQEVEKEQQRRLKSKRGGK